jgi:hypothetical protein
MTLDALTPMPMGFMARLKGMWRRHDERLVEGMEERASGVEGDNLSVTPGPGECRPTRLTAAVTAFASVLTGSRIRPDLVHPAFEQTA